MIEVIINGDKFIAGLPDEHFATVLGMGEYIGSDGKRRVLLELDSLPTGDYGRCKFKTGDKIHIVRLQQESAQDQKSMSYVNGGVGGGGGGTSR